ncbi:MAG TPA: DUF1330 domain-containing protein [Stellaceae bacterium]|nr:DUF1330 domain-containing protein [Stellaceae bacterium]
MPTPGYIIVEVEVTDPAVYQEYRAKVGPMLASHNARAIVRGKASAKEGPIPVGNIIVIEFDSVADAERFYSSPAYAEIKPLRERAANSRLLIVEGAPR